MVKKKGLGGIIRFPRLSKSLIKKICFSILFFLVLSLLLDGLLISTGALPPHYPVGDADLGIWLGEQRKSKSGYSTLPELQDNEEIAYYRRNEAGFASTRSMREFSEEPSGIRIVALGDSHTDLYYSFDFTHMGILQKKLRDNGCGGAEVLGAGHGFYSPLQSLILYEKKLMHIHPEVIVLNFYSGNDFYDLLRSDDRPHLVADANNSYSIHPPKFISYTPPGDNSYLRKSRVFYGFHRILQKFGLDHLAYKFLNSWFSSLEYGGNIFTTFSYINDLRKSRDSGLWYDGAVSSQVLNQALFFHHFPGSKEESLRRAEFTLLQMKEKFGDALLVFSLIPSRTLARPGFHNRVYDRILDRMPFDQEELINLEYDCYTKLITMARNAGWIVVDPLGDLRNANEDIYFESDLHISPTGSAVVGRKLASIIFDRIHDTCSEARSQD